MVDDEREVGGRSQNYGKIRELYNMKSNLNSSDYLSRISSKFVQFVVKEIYLARGTSGWTEDGREAATDTEKRNASSAAQASEA